MSEIRRRKFLRLSAAAVAGAVVGAFTREEAPAPIPESAAPMPAPTSAPTGEPTYTPQPTATQKPTETLRPAAPTATSIAPVPAPASETPWPREDVPRERTLIGPIYSNEITNVGIAGPYALGFDRQQGHAAELEPLYYYAVFADKTCLWLTSTCGLRPPPLTYLRGAGRCRGIPSRPLSGLGHQAGRPPFHGASCLAGDMAAAMHHIRAPPSFRAFRRTLRFV